MTRQRQVNGADTDARPKRNIVQRLEAALAKVFRQADAYHPEQHYLRGHPGPKAQAKEPHDAGK